MSCNPFSCNTVVYTTTRVVKIPNKCLYFTHKVICLFIFFYIGVYGLWYCKGYQGTSSLESVVVTKVKGIVSTRQNAVKELSFYNRVWDASDVIILSHGDDSGGFIVLTHVVITPNQTRGKCPESSVLGKAAECKTNQDCPKDKINLLGNGQLTGMCVSAPSTIPSQSIKTCEIFAWCPVELFKLPEKGKPALLENTKDFTVLVKNSIEFPTFGDSYKRRNIMESATKEYLQNCIYNNNTDPYCPTFRIGDIVSGSGFKYEEVAKTGGVFGLKIKWFCSFDFGASIQQCRPKYSFSRLDNENSYISPGFNFKTAVYHEENRRTLIRNYGIKILIETEGEGRKFDPFRLILAIGAGMGLFAIASSICDFLLKMFCRLKKRLKWKWLQCYTPDMKYDLTYMHCGESQDDEQDSKKENLDMDEIKTLQ